MTRTRLRAEEMQDGKCKLPCLYKACSVACTQTEPPGQSGVREEWGLNLSGNSGPVMGSSSLCFLEVLPPTALFLFLFFLKQIRFKRSHKEAFVFFWLKEGTGLIVSPPLPTPQPRPAGPPETTVVSKTSRGFLSSIL
ncbi:unnamed protein product [Rangifer tarandus platyrhynchus]|uniref:Uncharacterized protein n=2 Tax=Rangifer tarandus platyrhynchus TaxID=3082113 RepID=A0AC60A2W8_RANTA|nr:unnamed protein product [Rangifer tarandus platyrhynchus]